MRDDDEARIIFLSAPRRREGASTRRGSRWRFRKPFPRKSRGNALRTMTPHSMSWVRPIPTVFLAPGFDCFNSEDVYFIHQVYVYNVVPTLGGWRVSSANARRSTTGDFAKANALRFHPRARSRRRGSVLDATKPTGCEIFRHELSEAPTSGARSENHDLTRRTPTRASRS